MGSCVSDLASRRRTIRKFSSDPVDMDKVLPALEAACQAPSGANRQPWRFVIVTGSDVKRRIREACERGERAFYAGVGGELGTWLLARGLSWRKPFLEEAPLLALVLSDVEAPYSKESVWLAMGYALLALEELSLSTVTYTPSDATGVLRAVDAPEGFRLEATLPIGLSADEKPREPRRALHEVAFLNSWGHALETR
ncbi:NADH oxidase [miscellaneous Crenarchaeota group-15 archaeon DG-45]|uniref:NADH oxidase n=1 Tax=miscellaneous Crenarchaeota group-15 archaeon DG-45 TaxID=1685127 RepID=A0A0M0BKU7_9ARCH|nr:MAG: NADH oxidase [miscellaneous Crenarchaeota group-15 archaeon DG-45]